MHRFRVSGFIEVEERDIEFGIENQLTEEAYERLHRVHGQFTGLDDIDFEYEGPINDEPLNTRLKKRTGKKK